MDSTISAWYAGLRFKSAPFSITPDTSLFFPGSQHANAYNELRHACMNGAITALIGEIGLGKTIVTRCVMRSLPRTVRVAYLLNPLLDFADLLGEIYRDFAGSALPPEGGHAATHRALQDLVLQGAMQGERFVIIVDEAHRLGSQALEGLRLLSNLETEQTRLLSLVLVGQPELERTLMQRTLRPLRERIAVWIRLAPMGYEECTAYVRHRIARTHSDGRFPLSAPALRWLHWRTGGVPRRVNLSCERALMLAFARSRTDINLRTMHLACGELAKVWQ